MPPVKYEVDMVVVDIFACHWLNEKAFNSKDIFALEY